MWPVINWSKIDQRLAAAKMEIALEEFKRCDAAAGKAYIRLTDANEEQILAKKESKEASHECKRMTRVAADADRKLAALNHAMAALKSEILEIA